MLPLKRVLALGVILTLVGAGCDSTRLLGAKELLQQSEVAPVRRRRGSLAEDAVSGKATSIYSSSTATAGTPGKVDDLEIVGFDGGSPEVVEILVGGNAWRSRGLLGRLAARLLGDAVHVSWLKVDAVTSVVTLKRPAAELRVNRGDARWARLSERCRDPDATVGASEPRGRERVGHQLGHVHDVRGELVEGHLRVIGLVAGKLGILERYGVGTHGSGGPRQAKVHGHPIIPWERVLRIGAKVVVHD